MAPVKGTYKESLRKIKMNKNKSDQDIKKEKETQIFFELDGRVIKFPLSTFNSIIERESIKYMLRSQKKKDDIITLNEMLNVQNWRKKFKKLETQARMLDSIGGRLKRDLRINKFAQPMRCLSASVNQHVIVTLNIKAKMAKDALDSYKKKFPIFTISDSEDDDVIITDTSNIKSIQTKNDNIIDLIDLDNDTQNSEVKYKPSPKSKINSEDDPVTITDTSKIKPIPTKNDNIIDSIDLDNDTQNSEVKYKPSPKSRINSEDDPVTITDTSKIKPIPTKNDNIIDSIDLDNDTQNSEVKYKPSLKSRINSEDDPVTITDTSKIKPIPTKNDNNINLIDLDNDTQNSEVTYKPASKSKKNCKSIREDDPVIITDTSKIKPIPTKNDNIIDMIDLDNNTQNLEVKFKVASKSKTNVFIPHLKTNDNNKVLPIKTEAGNTLSNIRTFLSTTINKRKPGPKSKTMFVSDMVPFNAENEETPAKKKCLNECEVINNRKSNTINVLSCNSTKKLEVPEKLYNLKPTSVNYPPPYPVVPPYNNQPSWKNVPPIPHMTIEVSGTKVILTWDLNLNYQTAKIKMYELFVCHESKEPPHISMWKKKGNIDADVLPMACELEVFHVGHTYYFALRAVDVHDRRAPCAVQKTKI